MEEWEQRRDEDMEGETDILQSDEVKTKYLDQIMYNRFHNYRSVLPFHVDINSRMIVTHGIEVEDMIALPIPRTSNLNDLKLDSYQFLANEDMNAIETNERNHRLEYLRVCSMIATKVKKSYENNIYENQFNSSDEKIIEKYLENCREDYVLLRILMKLNDSIVDENSNPITQSTKHRIQSVFSELKMDHKFDLNFDLINEFSKNEYLIRSLLDIVSENNVPKKDIKVLEINLTNSLMAKEMDNHLASAAIYPIDVNYTIALKSTDGIPDDLKDRSFKLIEWSTKTSGFPNHISPVNLIILRDSPELWHLELESLIQEMNDSIVDKGFLLCVFRYKYTEPELTLNSMDGEKQMNNSELEERIIDFIETADNMGMKVVGHKCDSICQKALLFRKIKNTAIPSEYRMSHSKTK